MPTGLVGLYGHTFVENEHGAKEIQYQFRVVRALLPDRWWVQYYSFTDGRPVDLASYTEEYLLSDACKLYPDAETWHAE